MPEQRGQMGPPPIRRVDLGESISSIVREAARLVWNGGLVIYPTETFYGLGGKPDRPEVVERVYRIKGRPQSKALPLIAASVEDARRVANQWTDSAECLAKHFWPGPLTLLLPAGPLVSPALHAGTDRIAVRVSSHPVARDLAAAVGGLLISTSANPAGEQSPCDPRQLSAALTCHVDLVLDAGRLPGGLPSTIVELAFQGVELIRPGCIAWSEIEAVLDRWSDVRCQES